jgi:phage shock protein PspC (stress-responsive transcriptional regulator)
MKRLFRSESNKKIAGICGGIGEMMEADPTIIRLAAVVVGLITGIVPMVVAYLIAWWIIPAGKQGSQGAHS